MGKNSRRITKEEWKDKRRRKGWKDKKRIMKGWRKKGGKMVEER